MILSVLLVVVTAATLRSSAKTLTSTATTSKVKSSTVKLSHPDKAKYVPITLANGDFAKGKSVCFSPAI